MKKLAIISAVALLLLAGCDSTDQPYNYAAVYSPGGEIVKEGEIKSYNVISNLVIVKFADGITCETSLNNIVLINDKDDDYYINQEGKHDT